MQKTTWLLATLGGLLVLPIPRAARAETPIEPIAAVVAKVAPAVVKIVCVKPPGKPTPSPNMASADTGEPGKPMATEGSGFVIDPSGFVATNKHVIEDAISIYVVTGDGIRYKAKVVGETSKADIALLKVEAGKPLPTVAFGESDKVRVGDTAIVIGSPLGFDESVSAGVVSAVNRDIMESPFDDYIQTDAAINHGNSGGPLFNLSGEVIGMNSVLFAPGTYSGSVGLGFAIPSDELNFVYQRLIATGRIDAGMLPIRTQQVSWMLAQAMGASEMKGALVDSVDVGGDKMMKGQIKPGDVIMSFNGQMVSDPRILARKAALEPIGSDATLEIFRHSERSTVHVPILAWPEGVVQVVTDAPSRTLGLDLTAGPNGGVLVDYIDPSGSAASSGLQKGDLIVSVQARPVSAPDQALNEIKAVSAEKRPFAAVLVERAGQRTWMPLPVPR